MFSASFDFTEEDRIPIILGMPGNNIPCGYAVGTADVEEEDGAPCVVSIALGVNGHFRTLYWGKGTDLDRCMFTAMQQALHACERFNDAMDDAGEFRVRGLRREAA